MLILKSLSGLAGKSRRAVRLLPGPGRRLGPALQLLLVKRKMRQLGCRTTSLYVDMPESDYSKIRFTLKGKASSPKWLLHFSIATSSFLCGARLVAGCRTWGCGKSRFAGS